MVAELEAFCLHLVTSTSGEVLPSKGRAYYWTVVLTMIRVIWRELRKVRVKSETAYGSEENVVVVGQYFWGTLQAHIIMNNFLRAQF